MNIMYFIRENFTDVEFHIAQNKVSYRIDGIKFFNFIKPIYGCLPLGW